MKIDFLDFKQLMNSYDTKFNSDELEVIYEYFEDLDFEVDISMLDDYLDSYSIFEIMELMDGLDTSIEFQKLFELSKEENFIDNYNNEIEEYLYSTDYLSIIGKVPYGDYIVQEK